MKAYRKDEELMSLFVKLNESQINELETSIRCCGYIDGNPIVVWKEQGIIVDGYYRYDICAKLGVEASVREISFKDKMEAVKWRVDTHKGRKNPTVARKVLLTERLRPAYEQAARERQRKGRSSAQGCERHSRRLGEVNAQLAKEVGISSETYRKCLKVIKSDNERLKEELLSGVKTINSAYKELLETENNIAIVDMKCKEERDTEMSKTNNDVDTIKNAIFSGTDYYKELLLKDPLDNAHLGAWIALTVVLENAGLVEEYKGRTK